MQQPRRLHLELVVAHHDFADDSHDHVELDFGVGPDTGFDKCGSILGAGLIDNGKDSRAARLLDLGDFSLDGHGFSLFCGKVGDLDGC